MHRLLLILLIFIGTSLGLAFGETGRQSKPALGAAKGSVLLEEAKWYMEAKDYANSQKLILEAITASPDDDQIRQRARLLWDQVRVASQGKQTAEQASQKAKENEESEKTKNRLSAQLEEAQRLSAQGKSDQASQIALSVLKETKDPQLVEDSRAILATNWPSAVGLIRVIPQRVFVILGWLLDILIAILLVFVPLLLFRRFYAVYMRYSWAQASTDWINEKGASWNFFKYVRTHARKYRCWVLQGVDDTTKMSVAEAVIDSIKRLSETKQTGYADLLQMERMTFQRVLFDFTDTHVDPLPALEALNLQIGGVTLGGIAKAISSVRSWLNTKLLWIKGTAVVADGRITVRLTRRNPDDTSFTVTSSGDKSKLDDLAEAATYMMYYSLAKESSLSEAEAANKLREGKILLDHYVSGQDPKQLEEANKVFRNLRIERPTFNDVYLYEGIALDLLEQHDEAIKRFQYVKQNASDIGLRDKATYNEAVSLFRTYRPEALDESILILDRLIGLTPIWYQQDATFSAGLSALVSSPIKALALATKANVIAHKPIYWPYYCNVPREIDGPTYLQHKANAREQIMEWVYAVGTISEQIRAVLRTASGDAWDEATKQELRWAIQNAYGNVYLNCASNYFIAPNLLEAHEPEQRLRYLKHAYEHFQECELLLPPGVETLTNLATALLELCREDENYSYDQVRTYLRRAKEANPHYEYTDYRLAELWQQQGRIDEVIKVLRAFAKEKTPTIGRFRELYHKYSLELARFPIDPVEASPAKETTSAGQANASG